MSLQHGRINIQRRELYIAVRQTRLHELTYTQELLSPALYPYETALLLDVTISLLLQVLNRFFKKLKSITLLHLQITKYRVPSLFLFSIQQTITTSMCHFQMVFNPLGTSFHPTLISFLSLERMDWHWWAPRGRVGGATLVAAIRQLLAF